MNFDDIIVKQEWDENRNQRVMIIYGDSLNDGSNKNGRMDIISNSKGNSYYHATYLQKHALTNYTIDDYYQRTIKASESTFSAAIPIMIQNNRYNNILFTDTTRDGDNKKYGVFYFPIENPSSEQYETLNTLITKLQNYEEFLIYGKTYITEDRLLDNEITFTLDGKNINSLVEIIKKVYQSNKLKK